MRLPPAPATTWNATWRLAGGGAGSSDVAAGAEQASAPTPLARLRDGTAVGAWLLKANPAVWDIGTALRDGTELNWWRMARSYRTSLVAPGQPVAMWVTRGDPRTLSGVWALGTVTGPVHEDCGDPDDTLWRDEGARRQVRPRLPVHLEVLSGVVSREEFAADPRLAHSEILRVPRIGNPAALTPAEWRALRDLAEDAGG